LDKVSDVYDALNIGVAYGYTGPVRSNASLTWTAQPATDWNYSFNSQVDYKHADCDGNGLVDVNDGLAILQNYGLTHLKTNATNSFVSPSAADPYLYLDVPQDSVGVSTVVTAPIVLGTTSQQAYNVYGIAFSINYDVDLVDSGSVVVSFANSWLGTEGVDLMGLYKEIPDAGRVDVAVVRTDHTNRSGNGDVAEYSFVTTDNVSGKSTEAKTLNFTISNVKMIAFDETILGVNTMADSLVVVDSTSGIKNINEASAKVVVYSNHEILIYSGNKDELKMVNMYNSIGQNVFSENLRNKSFAKLDLHSIKDGVYIMQVETKNGRVVKKILLQK
jgi:hypothetical protein